MMKKIGFVPKDFTKAEKERCIRAARKNPAVIGELMSVFLTAQYRASQRVAGALEGIARKDPSMLQPHLRILLSTLESPAADTALKRNIPRILQWLPIPTKLQGRAVNVCFRLLGDPKELVAPKVFSMTVLANIAC